MKRFGWFLSLTVLVLAVLSFGTSVYAAAEPPYLADRVAQGDLPPLADRLPIEPLVLVGDEIGQYGGTIRTVSTSPTGPGAGSWFMGGGPFFALTRDGSTVIPNIGAGWE